ADATWLTSATGGGHYVAAADGLTMHIVLNGQPTRIDDGLTVAGLLAQLKIDPVRVAVELNEDIVSRERYADRALHDGDRIECVTFVGGG
ncbi:MAG: sulfur carrier protein ThiS, partial [Phycisphaerae bacterium]